RPGEPSSRELELAQPAETELVGDELERTASPPDCPIATGDALELRERELERSQDWRRLHDLVEHGRLLLPSPEGHDERERSGGEGRAQAERRGRRGGPRTAIPDVR